MSNQPTPTIEQSAAAQISETVNCWLAKKLAENESWQLDDETGDRKFVGSVTFKIAQVDGGKFIANLKTKVSVAPDTDAMELVIDDPKQAKLKL